MGLFDRFRKAGPSRSGVRRGRSGQRRQSDRTQALADGAASWPRPPDKDAGETVVVRRPPAGGAAPPLQSPPPQRPQSPPPHAQQSPPPGPAPADPTIYDSGPGRARGPVVGVLVGLEGKLQGEVYRLFDGESKLGRGEQCQVVLQSGRISREHALVMHQDGHFAIKPLSERNPTIVNGARVEGTELKDGDYLKLGDDTFRFRAV